MTSTNRLGAEDTAWLHMEDATNPMVVNALFELGGTLDVARLWSLVETRSLPPRFRARVVESQRPFALPYLETDPTFDFGQHIIHVELEPGDDALRAFVDRQASSLLPRDRPLWCTFVIDRVGAPTCLLFRVHHSLADGFALLGQLRLLCDEHEHVAPLAATKGTHVGGVLRQSAALARLVTLPSDPDTVFKHSLGEHKRVAWSRLIPIGTVKTIARASSATVNDVMVSAIASALGRQLTLRGDDAHDVSAMVPVNLRATEENATAGNRFGLVLLSLPVGEMNAKSRLKEVKWRMDRLKATPEAFVAFDLLGAMGHLPTRIENLGVAFFGKKASLVLTNVPGPRERLHLGGVPIERIVFWAPQAGRMGLGISIFSYAGAITVGVIADALVVPRPEEIVSAVDAELAELVSS